MSSFFFKNYAEAGHIGVGGFGAVVNVFDEDSGGAFAAKIFEPTKEADCTPEALRELSFMSLLTQTRAPCCITLHDFSYVMSSQRGLVAFMPLMKRDLSHAIDSSDLKASTRLRVAKDIFTALSYLHGSSPPIVHRDIKPENVLLDLQNRAFLTDFSFTRFISDGVLQPQKVTSKKSNTNKNTKPSSRGGSGVLGTPTYIAPEVFNGALPHPAVDCWASGVVLLELFQNSRLPVDRDKAALKILRTTRDALGEKPIPTLIKGLLRENPSDRISSASALGCEALSNVKTTSHKEEGATPIAIDYYTSSPGEIRSDILSICRRLQVVVPQTSVAATHYASIMRSADVGLLCVIACKMYEHVPDADEDLLDCLVSRRSLEDLLETQEQLLTVMKGCLLVPFAQKSP